MRLIHDKSFIEKMTERINLTIRENIDDGNSINIK